MSTHNGIPHGLAGKARRAHARSRSSRMYAQQLITEYFETDPYERRLDRTIPIRRRNDFVPSAWEGGDAGLAVEKPYLAYPPLSAPVAKVEGASSGHAMPATVALNGGVRPVGMSPSAKQKASVGRAPTSFKPLAAPPLMGKPERRPPLRLSGLLCGFAIGGAMAAAILLVLTLIVG